MEKFCKGRWSWLPALMAGLIMVKGMVAANMIQSNSVAHAIQAEIGLGHFIVASVLAGGVALVIIGGMKRIVEVSAWIAPWMVLAYIIAGSAILLMHFGAAMDALSLVFRHAFSSALAI